MNITTVSLAVSSIVGLIALVASIVNGLGQRRKIEAEVANLPVANVTIYADAARTMMEPLRKELELTQLECEKLRGRVRELATTVQEQDRKLQEQGLLVDDLTSKLEAANRAAAWYKSEFNRITSPPPKGS